MKVKTKASNPLASCLRIYFTNHLPRMCGVSAHTVQSYRDSLVLLFRFVATRRKCQVADLDLDNVDSAHVAAFLNHLEEGRGNRTSTRNVRLSAIHAFFRYASAHHPEHLERIQKILSIPFKRAPERVIEYLEYEEIEAVLSHIPRQSKDGRRDYVLLGTMFNTGARVQEVVNLRACDLQLIKPFQARFLGKGKKERFCPLWPQTARLLRTHCEELGLDLRSEARIFVNHRKEPLTRFGVRYILAKHLRCAQQKVPTLARKRLHPHSMRHSTAVALLKSGVDFATISQWLGHSSPNTTMRYARVDLEMKRQAIAKIKPLVTRRASDWRGNSSILEWLEAL